MDFEHYKHETLKCIYELTLNGKKYIGQTLDTEARFKAHQKEDSGCRYIRNAIQEYGWENVSVSILLVDLTLEEANRLETHYIDTLGTLAPGGYNLTRGGDCRELSEETKKLISEHTKKQWEDENYREKRKEMMTNQWDDPEFREANTKRLIDLWTDEVREAQSEKLKKQWKDEKYRKQRSEDMKMHMKERWDDEQYRSKLSNSQKKRYEKEEERENARKSHAHMRKFTDEELIAKDEELKGSVAKLSVYFGISKCIISRHKKRLELTGKCYK
ncbi:homing endonuclease [Only Syngen Nebraska virus 5]|uniref:homing endonuclease n=1 Tax=Only Syngen Nebraska virus 5 TaxID=1917232 RepID=UPI0009013CB2|nr:homing endonuclease [Only Syngen Nebraska virus 5]APC25733.1 GIY-YIG catalytic domain-containing endonuclease [Only Syngen Nebraska virus 5]